MTDNSSKIYIEFDDIAPDTVGFFPVKTTNIKDVTNIPPEAVKFYFVEYDGKTPPNIISPTYWLTDEADIFSLDDKGQHEISDDYIQLLRNDGATHAAQISRTYSVDGHTYTDGCIIPLYDDVVVLNSKTLDVVWEKQLTPTRPIPQSTRNKLDKN